MKIVSMFESGRPIFSFEIFPPKRTAPVRTIYNTLDQLNGLHPDFISVTYGAGGSATKPRTLEIADIIKNQFGIEPLMHLTCLNNTRADIDEILGEAQACGVENLLALRGDKVPEVTPKDDFHYASDLVAYLYQRGGFDISGACYPEGHTDALDMDTDLLNLSKKVDAGCSHLISQLFFDNQLFYSFLERTRNASINVPIEAGIMPVTSKSQVEKMVTLCGASLPPKFKKMLDKYENHPEALLDAGIAYAIDQIVDLVTQGVDGVHLYTMNNPTVARRISESVSSLFKVEK